MAWFHGGIPIMVRLSTAGKFMIQLQQGWYTRRIKSLIPPFLVERDHQKRLEYDTRRCRQLKHRRTFGNVSTRASNPMEGIPLWLLQSTRPICCRATLWSLWPTLGLRGTTPMRSHSYSHGRSGHGSQRSDSPTIFRWNSGRNLRPMPGLVHWFLRQKYCRYCQFPGWRLG